ncbi:MAG: iron uptake system protein EfeO [Candidatus Nanopelagicales bacterium]
MSRVLIVPTLVVASLGLAACGSSSASSGTGSGSGSTITVASSSDGCTLSATTTTSGTTTFSVTNSADEPTEFYVYAADGQRIIGEVENIGPAITRDLTVVLQPGTYTTACKPGQTGDGIRADFTVTGEKVAGAAAAELQSAADTYKEWVEDESQDLLAGTTAFVAAVKAGDIGKAKALYAATRVHWERIEPVAESFGDLDPRLDARVNDVEAGTEWTGWHRIEKALWADRSLAGMGPVADRLLADTRDLVERIEGVTLTADQVTNGAKELLDEVATGKVTGEEERYSRTDLWDFQANVDGAKEAFEAVEGIVATKDPELVTELDTAFDALQAELDRYKQGTGFVLYTALTPAQVKALAAKVEALSEPLSELTSAVVS